MSDVGDENLAVILLNVLSEGKVSKLSLRIRQLSIMRKNSDYVVQADGLINVAVQ